MSSAYLIIVWITTFILIWESVSQQAAQKYVRQGKALILSPDDTCGVSTLKKDKTSLQRLYDKGYTDRKIVVDFLNFKL